MNKIRAFLLSCLAAGLSLLAGTASAQPYVCMETNIGEFCMELLQQQAPDTVANFLNYVDDGDYDNTFIHRSEPGYIIQGGGYATDPLGEEIPQDASVGNEFNVSNTRGTVAMAKFPDQPDSATNEWFVNLTDNSGNLDFSNGGYTVFARIVNGMNVVDSIGNSLRADLSADLGEIFGRVPVLRKDEDGIGVEDLIIIERAYRSEDVVIDTDEPTEEEGEEEAEARYACTADWVSSLAPRTVCMDTNVGEFCMDLTPEAAPNTVANFLHYVADGDYDNSVIHRAVPDFVVQGGGFRLSPLGAGVPSDPAIDNEFNQSNTRGTVAMAKMGGNPNSATSEWFINLGDNPDLDGNNGGFTVFGRVREEDMDVVQALQGVSRWNLTDINNAFSSVPRVREDDLSLDDFVIIEKAYIAGAPENPCLPRQQEALAQYNGRSLTLPVRINDKLYRVVLTLQRSVPEHVFYIDTTRIISLADRGQEAAVYTPGDGMLRIPSVLVDNSVITDVELELTRPQTFEFTLRGFTPP